MKLNRRQVKALMAFFLLISIFVFGSSYALAKNTTEAFLGSADTSLIFAQVSIPPQASTPTPMPKAATTVRKEVPVVEEEALAQADSIIGEVVQEESVNESNVTYVEEIIKQTTITTSVPVIPTSTPVPPSVPVVQQVVVQPPPPQAPSSGRADEIFDAMNAYRQVRGLPTVSKSGTLCSIAQNRANENQARGSLSHDGFTNYVHSQGEFTSMSEVLFWADFQASGSYMVNEGWDKSSAHNQAINDPSWRSGCGGVAGNFAAFEFGA